LLTQLTAERDSVHPSFAERQIWLIRVDGTEEPRFLAKGYWPCWSEDGKRVFYHSSLDHILYTISVEGDAKPTPIVQLTGLFPTVSPDEQFVAYDYRSSGNQIAELSTGAVVTSLTVPPVVGGNLMNWSPCGRELSIGGIGLWIYDLGTKTFSRILEGFFGFCSWSHDRRQFAIERLCGQRREIWVATIDPGLSTSEAFEPARTIEEHCREMVEYFTTWIEADPDGPWCYLFRAACYTTLREHKKAAADFEKLAMMVKGRNYADLGWSMRRGIRNFATWAIEQYRTGAYEQAHTALTGIGKVRRATGAAPNSAEVAYIAMCLRQLGRDEEITAHLRGYTSGLNAWQVRRLMNALAPCWIDQYEAGKYGQALTLLTDIDKMRRADGGDPNSLETAYMAMSLHQLGRREEAVSTLEQLYRTFDSSKEDELLKWLCSAEKLIAAEDSKAVQVWECLELGQLDDTRRHLEELKLMADHQKADISTDIARAARFLARAYYQRGRSATYKDAGYGEVISNYGTAVEIDPNYARAFGELGWLFATCPEAALRDKGKAIENATRACEVTDWKNHRHIGVLAAVYAEIGDFDNAVKWQKRATELLTDEDRPRWQAVHESRLGLYQSGKTYRGASPLNPSTGAMVACWEFENSDGKVVSDSSDNGLDGTLIGDAHMIDDVDRGGHVLCLDGDKDWVDCGEDARFDIISEITVACWVKVRRFDRDWQTVISKGDSAWRLARDEDQDGLEFACSGVSIPGTEWGNILGKRNVNDGKWHHVAGVYDGLRMYLYVDGVLDMSSEASGKIATNAWHVLIGANEEMTVKGEPGRSFNGLIDDLRIYDYALSEAEIKAFHAGQGPDPTADRR
jgi:tetratricopeptide (TPR) repeat protein